MSSSSVIIIVLLAMAVSALWSIHAEVAKTDDQRAAAEMAAQERERRRWQRELWWRKTGWKFGLVFWGPFSVVWCIGMALQWWQHWR